MPDRILLFIPAYNCEKQVPRVLDQLLDPKVSGFVSGCIVVNNRSTDGTEAAVLAWMTKHPSKPVRLPLNNETITWWCCTVTTRATPGTWHR